MAVYWGSTYWSLTFRVLHMIQLQALSWRNIVATRNASCPCDKDASSNNSSNTVSTSSTTTTQQYNETIFYRLGYRG